MAAGKPTSQSSTFRDASSSKAVDGNDSTSWSSSSCTRTNSETNPWWRVDIGQEQAVETVTVTNRGCVTLGHAPMRVVMMSWMWL